MLRVYGIVAALAGIFSAAGVWSAEAPPGETVWLESYRDSLREALGQGARPAFARLDKNADGRITLSEFGAGQRAAFREFDVDNDGSIDLREYREAAQRRDVLTDLVIAYMLRWDTNRDGLLEKGEFRGRPGAFVEADADQDNVLHHAELLALLRNSRPLQYSPTRFMKAHDLDGDGLITEREWLDVEKGLSLFSGMDLNGDHVLRLPEVETFLFRYERRLAPVPEAKPKEQTPQETLAPESVGPGQPLTILPGAQSPNQTGKPAPKRPSRSVPSGLSRPQ